MVSNLFNRDEQGEIVSELIPVMKREHPRRPPTPENVMDYFLTRTRHNLHVVLCFSPVSPRSLAPSRCFLWKFAAHKSRLLVCPVDCALSFVIR